MSAITAKASRKMKKYAVLTREPRCFLGSFDFSWEQRKVSELFRVTRGYVLAATQTETEKTDEKPYPVYSSQTKDKGLMGYYKNYLYEDAITWTTDGANAGTVNYRAGKFYCTNVCGVLLSNEVKANQMIAEALNNVAKGYVSYVGNPKLMNNVMADIVIQIPTHAEEREQLSSFFANLDHLITLHQRECISFTARAGRLILTANKKRNTSSWEQRKLGDMMNVTSVKRIHQSDWTDSGVRFLRARDIVAAAKNEEPDDYLYISKEKYEEYSALSGKVGVSDLLVTGVGTIGVPYLVRNLEPLYFKDGNIIWFQNSDKIDGKFLFYSFSAEQIQGFINESAGIGTVGTYTIESGKKTPISLPNQIEQAKVGDFFQQLDNLITLHQRKFEKLTNVKKSMLEKMFPQNGSSYPEIRFKGFTDPWEQRKLGDIADIVGGGTPSTGNQSYWDGDIDWYAPAEIADQIYANSSQKKITGLGYENSSAKMLPPGTVLFTSRAGIGKTAILTRKGCTNQGFQSIVPHRGELDSYFIFSRTEELKRYGELVGAGSTFVEVSGKQMAVMELMMPPTMREQQTIGGFFQQLDHLITLHQRELEKLQNIKKSMLEKMFV